MVNPYIDTQLAKNKKIRLFDAWVNPMDLIWHQDKSDRKITVLSGDGWLLQMDNELPIKLIQNKSYNIPKKTYHRVLKGHTNLKLLIKE